MSNEKFTPGPWNLLTDKPNSGMLIGAERGDIICGVWNFSEANANLIAAAPDMYEALKKVNDLLDDYFQSKDELVPPEILEAYEIIESTLLKANPQS